MAWKARLTSVTDKSDRFDSVNIEIEYFNQGGKGSFLESYPLSVGDDYNVVNRTVMNRLDTLNSFRSNVEKMKEMIGSILGDERAASLMLEKGPISNKGEFHA